MALKLLRMTLLAAVLAPAFALAGNSSVIRSPLQNVSGNPDAAGSVFADLRASHSVFGVSVKLNPRQNYFLAVDGQVEGDFTTDSHGRGQVRFTTPASGHRPLLDFDPRGKVTAVLDASGTPVLQAMISGADEPTGIVVEERANLSGAGRGSARYSVQKKGGRVFEVEVSKVAATELRLLVDGLDQGTLTLRKGKAKAQFRLNANAGEPELDFDPRSAQIELFAGDVLVLGGKLEAKAKGVNFAARSTQKVSIPATSAAAAGHAEASLRVREDARKDFSVEVEDVPAGSYDLLVNGKLQGTITVAARTTGGTQGELEFSGRVDDDDAHELPLTFDPVGATLTIQQGSTVFFTGAFTPGQATPSTGGAAVRTTIHEAMASTGLDANATAEVEYEQEANGETEFEVEIEAVDAGKYQVVVGGTVRGTITATLGANGQVRGALKFKQAGAGEDRRRTMSKGGDDGGGSAQTPTVALNFDPRGKLIEITSAAGTFFSHVLGDGSAPTTGGTGTATVPASVEVALFSTGEDGDATAKAEYERNERGGEEFEVEVEDLTPGTYEVLVGGTVRGNISVVSTARGTRGKLTFDDEPKGAELPLVFDPLGQPVVIRQGQTVFFQRTLPSGK